MLALLLGAVLLAPSPRACHGFMYQPAVGQIWDPSVLFWDAKVGGGRHPGGGAVRDRAEEDFSGIRAASAGVAAAAAAQSAALAAPKNTAKELSVGETIF